MKNTMLYGIFGLIIGSAITATALNPSYKSNTTDVMDMPMSQMMTNLGGKTGDDFDKAFITQMTTHHQGAIIMAAEAKQKASHQEIKTLSENIISDQQKEINEMKSWYKSWYGTELEIEDVNPGAPMSH